MKRIVPVLALASAASLAHADEGHGDLTVYHDGGILYTGAVDHDTGTLTPDVRVFEAEFQLSGSGVLAHEPGIDIPDGAFAPNSQLLLSVSRALRVWNGSDFFSIAPTDITLEFGPQSLTTPPADVPVGPMIFDLDGEGGLHDHPDFMLNDDLVGIYLLEVRFGMSGFVTSAPAWIVFNYGLDEEEHGLAVEWVKENLVPAPGVPALLGLGGLVAGRRRR